ncbi:MAG: hypothetical protein QM760_17465 [Nibricoccus sp.]
MNAKTYITPLHFSLSADTRTQIDGAVRPLFSQDVYVGRVDVTIDGEYSNNTSILYSVTIRAQLRSEVLFEIVRGKKILPAVEAATLALQNRLTPAPSHA